MPDRRARRGSPCGQEQPPDVIIDYSFYEAEFEEFEIGPHTFRVRAIDIEGRRDPTPAEHSWVIAGGPFTTILSGPADEPSFEIGEPLNGGQTDSTSATFRYAADNAPGRHVRVLARPRPVRRRATRRPPAPIRPCAPSPTKTCSPASTSSGSSPPAPTGPRSWRPSSTRGRSSTPLVNEPPQTIIADAPATGTSQLMFELQGTDDLTPSGLLTFECGLDTTNPVEFVDCTSPLNILELAGPEGLSPIEHTLVVRAVDDSDPDGQPDPTPATYTWTHVLDTVEPQTTVTAGPALRILGDTPAAVEFTGTDNATPAPPTDPDAVVPPFTLVFECSLDGADFATCVSPADHTGLEPGPHTLRIARRRHPRQRRLVARHRQLDGGRRACHHVRHDPAGQHDGDIGDVHLGQRPDAGHVHLHAQRVGGGAVRFAADDRPSCGAPRRSSPSRSRRPTSSASSRSRRPRSAGRSVVRPTRRHPTRPSSSSRRC